MRNDVAFPCVIRCKDELLTTFGYLPEALKNVDFLNYSLVIDQGFISGSSDHAFYQTGKNLYEYSHASTYGRFRAENFYSITWRICTGVLVDKIPDSARVVSRFKSFGHDELNEPCFPLSPLCVECSALPDPTGFIHHPELSHPQAGRIEWIFCLGQGESVCLKSGNGRYHFTINRIMTGNFYPELANENLYAFMTINNKGFSICSINYRDENAPNGFSPLLDAYQKRIADGKLNTVFSRDCFYLGDSLYLYLVGRAYTVDRQSRRTDQVKACFVLSRK